MQPTLQNNGEAPRGQHAAQGQAQDGGDPLRQLRSQTPQESLGLAGQSGLFKASLQASVLFAIGFAVLTVIPYFMDKQTATAKQNAPAPEKQEPAPVTPPPANTPPEGSPKTPVAPKISGKEEALNKMGEAGTKTGTPKTKDPFKGAGDDDLPGLK